MIIFPHKFCLILCYRFSNRLSTFVLVLLNFVKQLIFLLLPQPKKATLTFVLLVWTISLVFEKNLLSHLTPDVNLTQFPAIWESQLRDCLDYISHGHVSSIFSWSLIYKSTMGSVIPNHGVLSCTRKLDEPNQESEDPMTRTMWCGYCFKLSCLW